MYISKISVLNYKCFEDTGAIEFKPGINIIVGKNNSGKTALIEALNLNFENVPHFSIKTLPDQYSTSKNDISSVEILLSLTLQEFYIFLNQIKPIGIPLPWESELDNLYRENRKKLTTGNFSEFVNSKLTKAELIEFHDKALQLEEYKVEEIHRLEDSCLQLLQSETIFNKFKDFLCNSSDSISFTLFIHGNSQLLEFGEITKSFNFSLYAAKYKRYIHPGDNSLYQYEFLEIEKDGDNNIKLVPLPFYTGENYPYATDINICSSYKGFSGNYRQSIPYKIFDLYKNRIYRFYAQRPQLGSSPYGDSDELKPDASNLPEVLNRLQTKRQGFEKFNEYVNLIFPQIKWISVVPKDGNFKILVWNHPIEDREDLALPLESCGTGISQVLAILYILVTSKDSRTIIIDEPQSFLHPGATRDLMDILELFPQHQYFITTHSPAIIAASKSCNLIQLKYDENEYKTIVSTVDSQNMYNLLDEVGVKLSDVFGADRILWVEGETEEICFPLILKKVAKEYVKGTNIMRVDSTGALLDGKNAKLREAFFRLHEKVSTQESLVPPAVGFIFDKEGKDDAQCKRLDEISNNSITWLTRIMYENYILHSEAIAYVINRELQDLPFRDEISESLKEPITPEKIRQMLDQIIQKKYEKKDKRYFPNCDFSKIDDRMWLDQNVHAGKLLEELFNEYIIPYTKTKHSLAITDWILENDQNHLTELINIIKSVFKSN